VTLAAGLTPFAAIATRRREVAEVKSRLVPNVSHECRTPVDSILGLTDIPAVAMRSQKWPLRWR